VSKTLAARRREAAEEVCWSLLIMMDLGGLDIPLEWRKYLADSMEPWVDLAVRTGQLRDDEEEQHAQGEVQVPGEGSADPA
jgi:hypothetical protein